MDQWPKGVPESPRSTLDEREEHDDAKLAELKLMELKAKTYKIHNDQEERINAQLVSLKSKEHDGQTSQRSTAAREDRYSQPPLNAILRLDFDSDLGNGW